LHRSMLRPVDRLGPGPTGQRLVAGCQQPGQMLTNPPPLRRPGNNSSKQAA
jgi:uncharacterized lipoprotein YajG